MEELYNNIISLRYNLIDERDDLTEQEIYDFILPRILQNYNQSTEEINNIYITAHENIGIDVSHINTNTINMMSQFMIIIENHVLNRSENQNNPFIQFLLGQINNDEFVPLLGENYDMDNDDNIFGNLYEDDNLYEDANIPQPRLVRQRANYPYHNAYEQLVNMENVKTVIPKNILNEFASYKVKNTHLIKDCSICQENYKKNEIIRELPCKHLFHRRCIDRWLLNESSKCPNCRMTVSDKTENINM